MSHNASSTTCWLYMLYPAIEYLLDDVTKLSRDEIKSLDSSILASWKQAVLTAGGSWMTRGFHLKNFTFSVRNYFTGALFYKHICQRGRDTVIKDELYPGTSKSMEGHAARVLYQRAKDDGMELEVQWQDADSSTSNTIKELFPAAQVLSYMQRLCR